MGNDQHGLYHGPAKNSTNHDGVFTFVDKMTKYVHVIPKTSTMMQKVLPVFTSTMFSRYIA